MWSGRPWVDDVGMCETTLHKVVSELSHWVYLTRALGIVVLLGRTTRVQQHPLLNPWPQILYNYALLLRVLYGY